MARAGFFKLRMATIRSMTQFYINLRKPSTCFTYYRPGDMIGPKRAAAQPARSDPGV